MEDEGENKVIIATEINSCIIIDVVSEEQVKVDVMMILIWIDAMIL